MLLKEILPYIEETHMELHTPSKVMYEHRDFIPEDVLNMEVIGFRYTDFGVLVAYLDYQPKVS